MCSVEQKCLLSLSPFLSLDLFSIDSSITWYLSRSDLSPEGSIFSSIPSGYHKVSYLTSHTSWHGYSVQPRVLRRLH